MKSCDTGMLLNFNDALHRFVLLQMILWNIFLGSWSFVLFVYVNLSYIVKRLLIVKILQFYSEWIKKLILLGPVSINRISRFEIWIILSIFQPENSLNNGMFFKIWKHKTKAKYVLTTVLAKHTNCYYLLYSWLLKPFINKQVWKLLPK